MFLKVSSFFSLAKPDYSAGEGLGSYSLDVSYTWHFFDNEDDN